MIIIVTIKNNTERANHYRNNQKQHRARLSSSSWESKTTKSKQIIIVTIKNNEERAKHHRNNQKQFSAR